MQLMSRGTFRVFMIGTALAICILGCSNNFSNSDGKECEIRIRKLSEEVENLRDSLDERYDDYFVFERVNPVYMYEGQEDGQILLRCFIAADGLRIKGAPTDLKLLGDEVDGLEKIDELIRARINRGVLPDTAIDLKYAFINVDSVKGRIFSKYFNPDSLDKIIH